MKTIHLLEPNDRFDMDDWCRPLYFNRDFSPDNSVYSTSMYGGAPLDIMKWVKVREVFGEVWQGIPIKEYFDFSPTHPGLINFEFVRGDIPREHQLHPREKVQVVSVAPLLENKVTVV